MGGVSANIAGLGSGPVTFNGGTLEFNGWTGSTSPDYGGNTNALIVPTNQTGTVHVPQRFLSPGLGGGLSGGGTMNLQVKFVRGDISGNWSPFAGIINVTAASGGDDFRVANANGYPLARLNLGANVSMYSRAAANSVIPIGEFSGAVGATVSADGASGAGGKNAVTWRVGGLNTSATNAASFQGIVALIKEGAGSWTLTGASAHTGTTIISNGTVFINGSFNGSPVTVNGGLLGGIGVISGAGVNVNSGAGFAPGNPLGTLTLSNNLTLASGSMTYMKVQHSPFTNSAAKMVGVLSENGTLSVSNFNGSVFAPGDHFKLFDATSYSGSFAAYLLPSLNSGLAWNTDRLNADGTLWVLSTVPPAINRTVAIGNNLVLSGTGGTPNWNYYVLTTTNLSLPTGQWKRVATNAFDGVGNFICTNQIDSDSALVLFRLQAQ
jgi:autotransporter-associated beta strand protein